MDDTSVARVITGTRLDGKVAIITGGVTGFGGAITRRFAEEGAKVVVMDINKELGNKIAEELGPNAAFVEANIMERKSWEIALKTGIDKFGYVNALVNNAGVTRKAPAHEFPESDFDLMNGLHCKSLYHSVQAIFPHFLERNDGAVINIASTGATRPRPGFTWYNMTKGGVITASKSLAIEYGPSIRVNTIVPAIGNTSMLLESFGGRKPEQSEMGWVYDMIPMKRITEPLDIGNAAVFLISREASFITGTVLDVDGGRGI